MDGTRGSEGQEYYRGYKTIGLTPRKGYGKFPIKGLYYRGLRDSDIGKFDGYAVAETDNKVDPFAVAIYREDDLHLGYIPAGNYALSEYIRQNNGIVHCYGYVAVDYGNRFYGEVCVETDKSKVQSRNKPYDTDDKYYTCTGGLKYFLNAAQNAEDPTEWRKGWSIQERTTHADKVIPKKNEGKNIDLVVGWADIITAIVFVFICLMALYILGWLISIIFI